MTTIGGLMQRDAHDRSPRRRRRTKTLVTAAVAALLVLLLGGGLAAAIIVDNDAEPCWSFYVDGPGGGNDSATDVALTAADTWVCGQMNNGDVKKLDASLTRIPRGSDEHITYLWNSASNNNDANYDVAVRGSYLYTSGASRNLSNNLDLLVIRWSTTGAVKWAKRWNGPEKLDDVAADVAVDSNGNVIVCGTTQHAFTGGTDWVVIKYSPLGEKKWTRTYDGPIEIDFDAPVEMIVDGAGNVYVTGTLITAEYESVAYTVKLSPKGVKLWSRRYAGPEPGLTAARALARCDRRRHVRAALLGVRRTDGLRALRREDPQHQRADDERPGRRLQRRDHRRRRARRRPRGMVPLDAQRQHCRQRDRQHR
jgi:hypothetical protein